MISIVVALPCWSMPAAGSATPFCELSVCMNFLGPSWKRLQVMAQMAVLQLAPVEAGASGEPFLKTRCNNRGHAGPG